MPLPTKFIQQSDVEEGQEVSQHSESSQWIKVKYAGRKNLCEICNNILAKYTCPKCDIKTCSLSCTKKHKEIKSCSGQKNPIQFVAKDQIDQKVVSKDYNFIEQMISNADKVKKVLSGVNATISLEPRRFKILRNNARQLYNIRLSNGPNILQRHRDNISFFFVKTKSIYWVFQLLYFQGLKQQNIKVSKTITQPISDQKTFLETLPQDYLDKQLLERRNINTMKREQFEVFLQNKQKINDWESENENKLKEEIKNVVFSTKIVSGKFTTLYELIQYNTGKRILQQMKDISVFEFPTLFVVHDSLRDEFLGWYKESKKTKTYKSEHKKINEGRGQERSRSREKGSKKINKINQKK